MILIKQPSIFMAQVSGRVFFLLAPGTKLDIPNSEFFPWIVETTFGESHFTSPKKISNRQFVQFEPNLRMASAKWLRYIPMNCPGEAAGTASLGCKVVA